MTSDLPPWIVPSSVVRNGVMPRPQFLIHQVRKI